MQAGDDFLADGNQCGAKLCECGIGFSSHCFFLDGDAHMGPDRADKTALHAFHLQCLQTVGMHARGLALCFFSQRSLQFY